jgi:AAA+ ATPase superfamily predicted ATPase
MFVNRERDLDFLDEKHKSNKAELIIIYGRRRVGKTRLLQEFVKNKEHIYLVSDVSENILDTFARVISKRYKFVRFDNWDDFFEFLYSISDSRIVIVIDEFQYLYKVNKAFPTIMQRWWETLKDSNGSALYGRKTAELEVKPLKFFEMNEFFPNYSFEELVKVYTVLGGVPRYLEEFDDRFDVMTNIKDKILTRTSYLYNEPQNLLFEEFKDYSRYFAILNVIAEGASTFSEISTKSRIPQNKLSKYLMTLERVEIIRKIIPITEKKSKRVIYRISDNFYRFWFRYLYPNKSFLEMDEMEHVMEELEKTFNAFVGLAFEEIGAEFLRDKFRVGRWW